LRNFLKIPALEGERLVPGDQGTSRRHVVALLASAPLVLAGRSVQAAGSGAFPAGKWLAEDIRGGGVIDFAQTVLEIARDGHVSGSGGCNRIGGGATVEGDRMTFSRMISTRMACTPALMHQESRFLDALADVRRFRVDVRRRKLLLLDAGGKTILRLSRM
jgi:putative lipoprotein